MGIPLDLLPLALLPCLALIWLLYRRRLRAQARKATPAQTALTTQASPVAQTAVPSAPDSADAGLAAEDANAIDVDAVDPKTEAQIYLSFGYVEQAAEVLRVHADQPGCADEETLATLCRLYLELHRPDDYCEILGRRNLAAAELEAAIRCGLKLERNHLGLRVLAEERLGLGPEAFSSSAKAAPQVPHAATAKRPPVPAAAPTRPPEGEGMALVTANDTELGALSADETRVVRLFVPARRRIRLFLAAEDAENALPAVREALGTQPDRPSLLIDLMQVHYLQRNVDGYARALWQFFVALGENGEQLRERLLHYGLAIGHHPAFAALAEATCRADLEAIGRRHGFAHVRHAPAMARQLVRRDAATPNDDSQPLLAEVDSYLTFGQFEEALAALETAITREPDNIPLYPVLLQLYERMDEPQRLAALRQCLAEGAAAIPDEAQALISACAKRLHHLDEVA
ncbi:tetratricopeptide repeat protein [Crenobacter caeni]|uniref:Uncharacterized protein n=1 Tax=Crenobacter caeni TaxID=2705474 RepID=A0A6B2KSF3_9NEIS|nr:hypothetical protein [Crenobacter caeni]NDV13176.1 hypothetical protein [Crenobacter caeni]